MGPAHLEKLTLTMDLFLKGSSLTLIFLGLLFIAVQLRTRLNECILHFGIFLIGLSAMVSVDIWIAPDPAFADSLLHWIRIQHAMGCLFILGLTLYTLRITGISLPAFKRFTVAWSLAEIGALLLTDMVYLSAGRITMGILYKSFFAPYFLFYVAAVNALMLTGLVRSRKAEKPIIAYHFSGVLILGLCGASDLLTNMDPSAEVVYSATTFGAIGYGLSATVIFMEMLYRVVAERNANEKRLESSETRLAQAEKLASLGQSASMINHELRNYIATIKGNAQLILKANPGLARNEELLRIERAVSRMDSLTSDILKIARMDLNSVGVTLELGALIRNTVESGFSHVRERCSIQVTADESRILCNPDLLEQVFMNVLKNSLEAGADEVRIESAGDDRTVAVRITDNGSGCSMEQLARLATPFYSTKQSSGGTGLGLSISTLIMEAHAGTMTFQPAGLVPRQGLATRLTFPLARPTPKGMPAAREAHPQSATPRRGTTHGMAQG